jgi:hypothetical protein
MKPDFFSVVYESVVNSEKEYQANSVCSGSRSFQFSFLQAHLCASVISRNKSLAMILAP